MDMTHKAEKWAGRALLFCGLGFMVLISVFAVSIIANPDQAHNVLLVGGFVFVFMVLGAPVGLLMAVLPVLRRINRHKDKCREAQQFPWMYEQ